MFLRGFTIAVLLVLFNALAICAQVINLSSDPDQFIKDFEDVFKKGKNEVAIGEFNSFKPQFQNNFSPQNRTDFIVLSQNMAKKGHKMPEYYQLLLLINSSMNEQILPLDERTKLVSYLAKLAAYEPMKRTIQVYQTLHSLFTQNLLYTSKLNKLYAVNSTFE